MTSAVGDRAITEPPRDGPNGAPGVSADADDPYAPSFMERVGIRYLRGLSARVSEVGAPHVVLDEGQRSALEAIERRAIALACLAGGICGIVVGAGETFARGLVGLDAGVTDMNAVIRFWEIFVAISVPATLLEILYLYRLGLRSVHALACVARLDLFADTSGGGAAVERAAVAGAMARAALELPNSKRPLFGVDPMREASKLRLTLAAIAYKLKIGATKFIFKAVVRRMLVRAFLRVWAPLVAIPITAIWSGVILWAVTREARIRVLGASAAREMMGAAFDGIGDVSMRGRRAVVRSIGACIVRSRDLHPNLIHLLREAFDRVGPVDSRVDSIDEPALFLEDLRAIPPDEQRLALRVLCIAAIIDGRLTRPEQRLVKEAQGALARKEDLAAIAHLRRIFVSGHAIPAADVRALA